MLYRASHPFAPARPGGTPLSELVDRHAHLVAVGLANCRAAQALKKEITRRQLEQRNDQLETQHSTRRADLSRHSGATAEAERRREPETLSNDDNHYDPNEPRDKKTGKWTAGPDSTDSKTDNPSHTGLIAKIGKGFNLFGKALVAELADIGSEITGQAEQDRRDAEEAYEEAENSVPWTDAEWEAVRQAMRNNDTEKAQELIDAHNAKVALVAERNPKMPLPDNMTQLMSGDQDLRAESDLKLLPGPARVAGRAAQGLVESSPRMAAVAMLQSFGVPAPVAVGLVFGTTEHGYDLKQAAFAAALYFAGEYSGEISSEIVKRFGGDNAAALKALKTFMANAAPAAGIILQQQLAISKLPPDQQKDARIEMWATLVGMAAVGPHGEEGKPGEMKFQAEDAKEPAAPTPPVQTQQQSASPNLDSDDGRLPSLQGRIPNALKRLPQGYKASYFPDGSFIITNPKGVSVKYNALGFPDFSPYLYQGTEGLAEVRIKVTGNRPKDEAAANAAAGFRAGTPERYTWHHNEDTGLMQLVETKVHDEFSHLGGVSIYKNSTRQ